MILPSSFPAPETRRLLVAPALREDLFDDTALDVGQAVVAALEAVGEPLVVEAEQVEDRGLEVVDVDLVASATLKPSSSVSPWVKPALDAAAGQEDREAVGEWSRPRTLAAGGAALAERRAAELAAPDDQRLVEQAALLQVA